MSGPFAVRRMRCPNPPKACETAAVERCSTDRCTDATVWSLGPIYSARARTLMLKG